MSSGYRCPGDQSHGNYGVGGAALSRHVFGDAADFYSLSYENTIQELIYLAAAAEYSYATFIQVYFPGYHGTGTKHVHADWR
jgi:hypothetical protein